MNASHLAALKPSPWCDRAKKPAGNLFRLRTCSAHDILAVIFCIEQISNNVKGMHRAFNEENINVY